MLVKDLIRLIERYPDHEIDIKVLEDVYDLEENNIFFGEDVVEIDVTFVY